MSKKGASKRIIVILQSLRPNGVQKNMIKPRNLTKNKVYHRYFDNNFQQVFETNMLDNGAGQILLIVDI